MKSCISLFILIAISFQSSATDQKTEEFLQSCFKEYILAVASSDPKTGAVKSRTVRKRCLTAKFNKEWDDLVSTHKTGADAFLLAQDYLESWKKYQFVKNLTTSTADVVLGKNQEAHCLQVRFARNNTKFKISSIQTCTRK